MIHLVLVQYAFTPFRDKFEIRCRKEKTAHAYRFKFIADDTSFLSSASSTSKAKITNICGYAGSLLQNRYAY